ncbi:MAG: hypothetical protein LC799_03720, partial [Actinobacteria bacterium]|nr:hypothetical protein [Actinomycetota bacterium]
MYTVPRWPRYTTSWRTLGERVWGRPRAAAATTPDRFRLVRTLAVLGLVLAGTVVTVAVETTAQATRDIAERIEPISAGATTLYRSLAGADATLTSGFLAGGPESPQVRQRFDDNVATAARSLAATSAQAGGDIATTDRVGDIAALLPMYTGLAEQARANNQLGRPEGATYLERASDLMRSALLPTAEAVQVRQATQLDETYESATAVPVTAIVLGLVLLAGLGGVQWYLFHRTRRVFNLGALVAT